MDNSIFIAEIRRHIDSGHQSFPSYTPLFLQHVRAAIAERTADTEQQEQLIALERELVTLLKPADIAFPGQSAAPM